MADRLQKVLSQWGIASRRQAEAMITQGRVHVNGNIAHLGQTVDLTCDQIAVDGQPLQPQQRPEFLYFLLHKPKGVVSSCWDPQHRPTVLDLLPEHLAQGQGLHPVGRLDIDSTGALILTNDGALTYELTHPRHQIPKTYQVCINGHPHEAVLEQWRRGILLDNQSTLPAQVRIISKTDKQTQIQVILYEGRNRQIRRVAELLGHPVVKLHRSAIGTIQLGQVPSGQYRPLKPFELRSLQPKNSI